MKRPQKRADDWPHFVDGRVVFACWTDATCKYRVFLIGRDDSTFSLCSEHFSDHEFEMCWIPDDKGASFFDSKETAVNEIYSRFPWTRELEPERRDF